MIARRAPIQRYAPLPRPSHRIAPLGKRGRRRAATWAATKRLAIQISGSRCKYCGKVGPVEGHHRRGRRCADDSIGNCVLLCSKHHKRATENPAWALRVGLSVSVNRSPVMKGAM